MNKKKLLPIIGIIILIYILINLDFHRIIEIFRVINPLYSFLSFFAIVPLLILANIEWQLLLKKQKIKVSFWYSIKNFFIGYFYGFITPGGFGAYTRAIYLSEESGAPLPKCVSNIIIFNTVEFVAMMLVGAVGAIYLSSVYPYLLYTIILVLLIAIFLFLFFFKKERSKILFTRLVQLRIFATVRDRLEGSIDSFYEDIPRLKNVLLPLSLSILGWIVKYAIFFYIAKLFGINIPFIQFFMIMAVVDVIASIPISIYGIGTREATLIPLFLAYSSGVTSEQIVGLSLFWFVIIWLTPSLVGAFVTFFETKKMGKIKLNKFTVKNFEKYMKKYPELYRELAVIVKKNVSRKNKKPYIVDLGVGPGLLSLEISKNIPNATVIGIDPSKEMLKLAKENIKDKNIELRQGISEKIPVSNAKSDLVVSRFSLTYWNNPRQSFVEINRVLIPKGKAVLECLNRDFPKWKLFLVKIHMYLRFAGSEVVRYHIEAYKTAYSMDSVRKLFLDSDFKILYEEGNKKDWKFIFVAQKK
jgi:uncharacterized protein (TIRG00374 family)